MTDGRRLTRMSAMMCAAAILFMGAARTASATVLAPGSSGVPVTAAAGPTSDVLLASTIIDGGTGFVDVQIRAQVYRNSLGLLDFYYQIFNTSTSGVEGINRSTDAGFAGFSTDVYQVGTTAGTEASFSGFFAAPSAGGGIMTSDRSFSGLTVGFNFFFPMGLQPGTASSIQRISTNATAFGSGFTSAINGGTFTGRTFAPAAVPEPASLTLLGLGLVGVGRAIRHRMKNKR